jgi:hypothetical protein
MERGRKAWRAIEKFGSAHVQDHMFTWLGVRITKLHIYGGFAGTLSLIDWFEGHLLYSCGVWGLALLDMSKDLK